MTERVVEFARNLSYRELPTDVVHHSKLVLLDTMGALLAASNPRYPAGRILVEFIKQLGGAEESTIIGYGFRSSCVNAAVVNGTFGYYCDIEAHHPEAVVHPAATIVPTCLAVGERERVDGKTFLVSLVLGTDMDCRVSLALNPRVLYDRGFHPSCVAGTIGATFAAGRLMGLDHKQFPIALGLAGQQTCGLLAWKEDFSENARPFNHGIAARNGVTAAFLAKLGFGAPPDVFEGRYNILRAFSQEPETNTDALTRDLGQEYMIRDLAFKKYSCCAFLHPGLDALLKLMKQNHLQSRDIESIVLRFPKNGTELIDGTELRSHSAQYILPVAAFNRQIIIDDILYDRTVEPEINRMVAGMRVVGDEDLDKLFPKRYASIVEITLRDGRTVSERVDYASGTPENPFQQKDIEEKFYRLSRRILDPSKTKRIMGLVEKIDLVEDINSLGDLLRK